MTATPNRYPQSCEGCGRHVPAMAGIRVWRKGPGGPGKGGAGKRGGKYAVYCATCRTPSTPYTPEPGITCSEPGCQSPARSGFYRCSEHEYRSEPPRNIPKPDPAPEPENNTPAPVTTPGTVEDALRAFVESVASRSVDIEQVRTIALEVATEVGLGVPQQVTVTVKQDGREPVTVEGAHSILPTVLAALQARPVLLVGPAGSGKTTLAEQVATALGKPFYMNGAIATEYKLTGFVDANGTYHSTPFRQAFENGGVYLFDELDASSEQALLAFNAGLANGHMDFPDRVEPIKRHPDFTCLAAANTWGHGSDREYVGRNQLDGATLNRFIPVTLDYDRSIESRLAGPHSEWLALCWRVRDRVREHRMRHIVSMREVDSGRVLLDGGMSLTDVSNLLLRRNLSEDDWRRVSQ